MKFLAEISKPQYQAEFTKYITYGPTNKKAYDLGTIDAAYAKRLPSYPGQRGEAAADQPRLVHQVRGAGRGRVPEHADRIGASGTVAGGALATQRSAG